MRRYLAYVKPHMALFLCGSLFMAVESVGEIVQPYLMANILSVGIPHGDGDYILWQGIGMIAMAAVMLVSQVIGVKLCVKASMRLGRDMRNDVYEKMQQFASSNTDRYSEPSLVTRLTNDVTQVQNVSLSAFKLWLKALVLLVLGCTMAYVMNPTLSVLLIVAMPIMAAVVILLSARSFPRFEKMQHAVDAVTTKIQENLQNVRVVKAFARGDYEVAGFEGSNEELRESSTRAYRLSVSITPAVTAIMNAVVVAIVLYGGSLTIQGQMEVGALQAFAAYALEILAVLQLVGLVIVDSTRAVASFRRMVQILDEPIDLTSPQGPDVRKEVADGRIEFRDVSFKYFKNNPHNVLDRISFAVEPGQTLGIIGSTGSGKTTVASLIPRLYDVDEGSVRVGGCDVREYDLEALRQAIGFVPQQSVLFTGTIQENVAWGNPSADEQDIRKACEDAQADGFVSSFAEGYQTMLEQGGSNLSGGQRQRLCIARALVKRPKVLVFDDSTSAVDLATERRIRERLATANTQATKVIIAQRIASVRDADAILVLDEGHVVGYGSHEQLLESCETYGEIHASQSGR